MPRFVCAERKMVLPALRVLVKIYARFKGDKN